MSDTIPQRRKVGRRASDYDSKGDTLEHIRTVTHNILNVIDEFTHRIRIHDVGKLGPEEKPTFDEMTPKLADMKYGSKEYFDNLKAMKPALDHHYATNRHHPEHFDNGISDMNLIDLLEMMCDWLAASRRHTDGDPIASIHKNQARFGYSDDLKSVFLNTMNWLLEKESDDTRDTKEAR